ncbi:MAG: hypothetical protein R2911_45015 [Caldilineaceae bacterium]
MNTAIEIQNKQPTIETEHYRVEWVKRPQWSPLPFEGCIGVEGKVFLDLEHLAVALLRFQPHATIHEHAASFDIDVICMEGSGCTSVNGQQANLQAGQKVRWPAHLAHRLWTESDTMITLMVEHPQNK